MQFILSRCLIFGNLLKHMYIYRMLQLNWEFSRLHLKCHNSAEWRDILSFVHVLPHESCVLYALTRYGHREPSAPSPVGVGTRRTRAGPPSNGWCWLPSWLTSEVRDTVMDSCVGPLLHGAPCSKVARINPIPGGLQVAGFRAGNPTLLILLPDIEQSS